MCRFRNCLRMCLAQRRSAQLARCWAILAAVMLAARGAGLRASGANAQGVTTELISVWEERAWHSESERFKMVHISKVVLRLHGDELRDAAAYANISVDEAVDDTGASLVDRNSGFLGGLKENIKLQLLTSSTATGGADPTILVDVEILPPGRKATKIVRLRGHVQVRAGGDSVATVRIAKLGSQLGKQVSDPALDKQQLTLNVRGGSLDEGKGYVTCNTGGNIATIRKCRVVDADGKVLKEATQTPGRMMFNTCDTDLELPRPADDRMTLEIDVVQDQKVLTVPFELHDVELP